MMTQHMRTHKKFGALTGRGVLGVVNALKYPVLECARVWQQTSKVDSGKLDRQRWMIKGKIRVRMPGTHDGVYPCLPEVK